MCFVGFTVVAQGKVLRMEDARLGFLPAWRRSGVLWEYLCRGGKQWDCGTGNMCMGNVGRQGCTDMFFGGSGAELHRMWESGRAAHGNCGVQKEWVGAGDDLVHMHEV